MSTLLARPGIGKGNPTRDVVSRLRFQGTRLARLYLLSGFWIACWFAPGQATLAAEEGLEPALVGDTGDPAAIEFEGAEAFTPRVLRNALAQDATYILASHPAARMQTLLEVLREKLQSGYLHNGFPEADVSTSFDPATHRFHVRVKEGPRFRCGQVKVTGAKAVPVAAIVDGLTKPVQSPPPGVAPPPPASNQIETGASTTIGNPEDGQVSFNANASVTVNPPTPGDVLMGKGSGSQDRQLWIRGEPAAFGEPAVRLLESNVKETLAAYGLFFPTVKITQQTDRTKAKADLLVEILDEGPQGTIAEIQVTGNRKNTAVAILELLGLKNGMAITRPLLAAAEDKLWKSGRFLGYEIEPEPASTRDVKPTQIRLVVTVHEYELAPRLADKLSAEEAALMQFSQWLSSFRERPEDLVIAASYAPTNKSERFSGELVLSPRDGALLQFRHEEPKTTNLSYSLLFAKGKVGFYAQSKGYKLEVSQPDILPSAFIRVMSDSSARTNPFNLTMGLGFRHVPDSELKSGAVPPFQFDLKLAPAAFLEVAHNPENSCAVNGTTLAVNGSNFMAKAEAATGQLIEMRIAEGESFGSVRFAKGAFERARRDIERATADLPNRFVAAHPLSSIFGFAFTELARLEVLDKMTPALPTEKRERAAKALNRLFATEVLAPLDRWALTSSEETFTLPADELDQALMQNSVAAMLAAFAFGYCNDLFPKYSWPWTVARESVFVMASRGTYAGEELDRLFRSDDTGPIGSLVIARLLSTMNPVAAKSFAVRGLTRLTAADFLSDCQLFLQGETGLARSFANVAATLREMPDEDIEALAAALPSDESTLLKEWAQALRAGHSKPLATSLAPALEKYWRNSLGAKVRAELQKITSLSGASPARKEI